MRSGSQFTVAALLRILSSSEGEAVVELKEVQSVYLVELSDLLICQKIKVDLQQLDIRDFIHLIRIQPLGL